MEKETVSGVIVIEAIHDTLGPAMQAFGIEWVYADSENKLHQRCSSKLELNMEFKCILLQANDAGIVIKEAFR